MQEKIIVGVTDAAVSRRAVDWATERATIRGDDGGERQVTARQEVS